MKKTVLYLLALLPLLGLYACDNNLDKVFDEQTLVEFQQAVVTSNAVGRNYPIISTGNSTTGTTTVTAQLNLVGRQRSSDLTVRVLPDPSGTTAAASSYTLANGGTAVFAPNSSTTSIAVTVSRASSTTAPLVNLVLVIDSTNAEFKPSQNYKRVGYSFRQ